MQSEAAEAAWLAATEQQCVQNGYLMSRRGCSLPVFASGFAPHRASISRRFGQVRLRAALVRGAGDGAVSRPFSSWTRPILTEMYLG
jgi:hypothetical protein